MIFIFVPGASSIEVGFSAENSGESTDLTSSYDVDTGVSVSEESTACFGQPAITNTRSVSGSGNINAVQTYSGSGGYAGSATLSSQDVSGSLQSTAFLTPQYLSASQDLSFSGKSVDTGMSLANKGDSANLGVAIKSGMIASQQAIQTGSVFNDISATCTAPWAQIKQQTSFKGIIDSTTTIFDNPVSKASVFNLNANSNNGGATGSITSCGNLYVGKEATDAEVSTIVENAARYTYRFTTNPGEIFGLALDVDDADSIYAQVYASNKMGGYSGKGMEITKGSLHNYENHAYSDETGATSYQKFREASGDNIRINQKIDPNQVESSGYASTSYAEITGDAFVQGYSNYGHAEMIAASTVPGSSRTTSSQSINYAEGINIEVGTQAINHLVGESASVITKVDKYGSGKGNIFLYSDESDNYVLVPTEKMIPFPLVGYATSSADINAVGTSIDVKANDKPGILQNNKLSASIGVKAESNQEPVITKEEWKGLALIALRSNAVQIPLIGPAGHVGVGVWNDDGTWTIGAVENSGGSPLVLPGWDNGGWSQDKLTWLEVTKILHTGYNDDSRLLGGNYDKIKIIKVSDNTNPVPANLVMDDFKNRGYWLVKPSNIILDTMYSGNKYWSRPSNDCLDATVDALQAYGAKVPSPWPLTYPKYYFGILDGKEYTWNPAWNTYV